MLLLKRTCGEKIILDLPDHGRIEVVLAKVFANSALIGIEAGRDVVIRREELVEPGDEDGSEEAPSGGESLHQGS